MRVYWAYTQKERQDKKREENRRKTLYMKKLGVFIICLMVAIPGIFAENIWKEIELTFKVGTDRIDPNFEDNQAHLDEISAAIEDIQNDSTVELIEVLFRGSCSPEGSHQRNMQLTTNRMKAIEQLVRSQMSIPDSIIRYDAAFIPWERLAKKVEASNITHKKEILETIDDEVRLVISEENFWKDRRILELRELEGGKPWNDLNRLFFGAMRNAAVSFVLKKADPTAILYSDIESVDAHLDSLHFHEDTIETPKQVIVEEPEVEFIYREFYLKTNAIGWGMFIPNVAYEFELDDRWSVDIPFYYSGGYNYFKEEIKFRCIVFQPELRYYLNKNKNFYAGAHAGIGWYNFALNRDYRIQDAKGIHPAWGGGLSLGYRLKFKKNDYWTIDFCLGAGVYDVHYDMFYNESNGPLAKSNIHDTFFGIDKLSVSFSYHLGTLKDIK